MVNLFSPEIRFPTLSNMLQIEAGNSLLLFQLFVWLKLHINMEKLFLKRIVPIVLLQFFYIGEFVLSILTILFILINSKLFTAVFIKIA